MRICFFLQIFLCDPLLHPLHLPCLAQLPAYPPTRHIARPPPLFPFVRTVRPVQARSFARFRIQPTVFAPQVAPRRLFPSYKIASLGPDEPFYTFEVFPPKTSPGVSNLISRLSRMSSLNPSWIHITWGAGGSTHSTSLQLAEAIVSKTNGLGLDACLHLTCTNMERSVLDEALKRAKELGVVNLLALRGDPPRGEEYWVASDGEFQHATDLIAYIKEHHGNDFCIGVAGYPEGHADSADKSADIDYLFAKQQAGAEFVVTQLFYCVETFLKWHKACRDRGITIPILPGIMPIQNYQSFRRMTNLCKSHIPPQIVKDLELIQHDDQSVKDYGVRLAVSMMRELWQAGIRGYHLCTLNLEKSVSRVLEQLDWVEHPPPSPLIKEPQANGVDTSKPSSLLPSQVELLRAKGSKGGVDGQGARKDSPTSWDEFPNGRFGDARSPAYGDLDGYGVGLKLTPAEALRQWGSPTTLADVSNIFSSYLSGKQASIPWSEEALRAETKTIAQHLIRLNDERHWWTVGSQPAVDGAPSGDPVYGFGAKGGYVYQKAFVEFFLTEAELDQLERRAEEDAKARQEKDAGEGLIKWYAGNREGRLRSNMKKDNVNAVTWGVFNAQDIVTTTLIEEMSFKAWSEEAFAIWLEWSHLYPANSASRRFIRELADTRWLVSVAHHDYKQIDGLWQWLLAAPKV
ncbi:BZ3500_MvSof-1268-A1-R1_Chr4-3g07385 [Microbotryum saponariae]|uniref:BZ3500_MvSof-1268-A1-R1_Chr4-3g07385 protein n=1 Tax=Microbotryum saponariae TaxID=289078 RepID=A0A2X0LP10_9BASI|nr:BZ3500_MvSof-1268-A1-R1_Chr4-3g07385 [Microbotryum saponariae]SDA07048.1 BZ3501_MvSof-1269-A2-R1_Chr4-2g07094 [Microbotryum saponariae]